MACRIGITTNLQRREAYWLTQYPRMYNFREIARFSSKEEAQAAETMLAREQGCVAEPGGQDSPSLVWSVYRFDY